MDPDMLRILHPGPLDASVLHAQHHHRSEAIWAGEVDQPLQCRRCDGRLWRAPPLHARVLHYVNAAGFYGVYMVGRIILDHSLITAFVERWRTETHSFHLPVGEVTITLQDVAILWGLPIDGEPVTGADMLRPTSQWQDMCEELLNVRPTDREINRGTLLVSFFEEHFSKPLPDDATDDLVRCYARAYILWMIGGCIFSDTSGSKVKLMYLPLIRDLGRVGRFSWGSAALGTLYRALCRASRLDAMEIGGPLVLLQLWIWERFATMRPQLLIPREHIADSNKDLPGPPYGIRWRSKFSLEHVGTHVLRLFRDQLDYLRDDQYEWQPYADEILAQLPEYCLRGRDIWQSVVPLICFEVVEYHHPDRVLRQFGLEQGCPEMPKITPNHHLVGRRGRANTDWKAEHVVHIKAWDARHTSVIAGTPLDKTPSKYYPHEYMRWYRRITRSMIGNPSHKPTGGYVAVGGITQRMVTALQLVYHKSIEAVQLFHDDATELRMAFTDIQRIASQTLISVRESTHTSEVHNIPDKDPDEGSRRQVLRNCQELVDERPQRLKRKKKQP